MPDFDQNDAFEQDQAFQKMTKALDVGNFTEAQAIGYELRSKYPEIPRLLVFCASAHEEAWQFGQAKELYLHAVKVAKAQIQALDDGEDSFNCPTTTIEESAERAAIYEVNKQEIYCSMDLALLRLALMHQKQGRRDLCVQALEKAVAERDQSVFLNAYLAMAYRDSGRTADAIQVCRKCFTLDVWSGSEASWRLVAELCGGLGLKDKQQYSLKYAELML